ncbi:MAG TPA: HlyD family efflux transporter periplasmic adaptor subunit [Gammaproteobacteria bacterium]|nr:HlyD family efflux transporter periplasmic adaptor subunit [Gammaproteobacteria bacterium]
MVMANMHKFLTLATLSSLMVLHGCDVSNNEVASLGTLEKDRIELTAETHEPITRVFVQEGDLVEVGTVLIQQDTSRAKVALEKASADEAVARAALVAAEAGPRQQQISASRARLVAANSALQTIKGELDRALSLVERKLASQNRVDLLQGGYNEAQAKVLETSASLDELLEGTRSEDIDQARSRHTASVAVVRDIEITLARATTKAPLAGLVEALPFEIGERPNPGATVVALLASGRTYARVFVSEPLRVQLKTGSRAEVRLDGKAEPLQGHLRWISSAAAFTPYFALNQYDRSRLSYLAEVDLDADPDIDQNDLPVGVPVEVRFPDLPE